MEIISNANALVSIKTSALSHYLIIHKIALKNVALIKLTLRIRLALVLMYHLVTALALLL